MGIIPQLWTSSGEGSGSTGKHLFWHFTNLRKKGKGEGASHLFGKAQLEKELLLRRKQ